MHICTYAVMGYAFCRSHNWNSIRIGIRIQLELQLEERTTVTATRTSPENMTSKNFQVIESKLCCQQAGINGVQI